MILLFLTVLQTGVLAQENTPFAKRAELGLYIQNQEWNNAQSLIDSLPINTSQEQYYKLTQEISLDILTDTAFVLSQSQDSLLQIIADEESPESAYAQGILALLKEQLFDRTLVIDSTGAAKKAKDFISAKGQGDLLIYPNPGSEEVYIELPNSLDKDANLSIYDIAGKQLRTVRIEEGQNKVVQSVNDLHSGIYFITIENHNAVIYKSKLLIAK